MSNTNWYHYARTLRSDRRFLLLTSDILTHNCDYFNPLIINHRSSSIDHHSSPCLVSLSDRIGLSLHLLHTAAHSPRPCRRRILWISETDSAGHRSSTLLPRRFWTLHRELHLSTLSTCRSVSQAELVDLRISGSRLCALAKHSEHNHS